MLLICQNKLFAQTYNLLKSLSLSIFCFLIFYPRSKLYINNIILVFVRVVVEWICRMSKSKDGHINTYNTNNIRQYRDIKQTVFLVIYCSLRLFFLIANVIEKSKKFGRMAQLPGIVTNCVFVPLS